MSVDRDTLIRLLSEQRLELGKFQRTNHSSERWTRWVHKMDVIVRNSFSPDSSERNQFSSAIDWGGMITGPTAEDRAENRNKRFDTILRRASAWLDALIFQVETFGLEGQSETNTTTSGAIPMRYRLTSPLYIAELLWSRSKPIYRWIVNHKIHSLVVGLISLISAIVGILAAVGAI